MLFGTNCEIPLLISMVHHIKTMKQNKRREKKATPETRNRIEIQRKIA